MLYNTIKDNEHISVECNPDFVKSTDIIIVGTGTAGAVAAICAAEEGLDVIAVDKTTLPGGVAVASGVWAYYFGLHGGREESLNNRALELIKNCGYADYSRAYYETNICIPSAPKCIAIEEALTKKDCRLMLDSIITGVYTSDNTVEGLQLLTPNGIENIRCKTVIDSANGEVCRLAGCALKEGRRHDNITMRFSKCIAKAAGNKVMPVWANFGYIDNLTPEEYSSEIMKADSSFPCLVDSYGNDNCIIFEGSIICRREVRCIKTRNEYTLQDYFNNKPVNQPVCYTFSHMDNSNPDMENEDENVQNWQIIINALTYGVIMDIDMDCLISKEYSNLFVAGKHIGVGHDFVGCIRMKADIEKIGEAAALIAAVYTKNGSIDYESLKPKLIKHNLLPSGFKPGIAALNHRNGDFYLRVSLPQTADDINTSLSSQSPELALLYIKKHSDNSGILSLLNDNLKSSDMILRHNSAIALGLIGRKECMPILHEIISMPAYVLESSDFQPENYDWLNYTRHCNMVKALCLIGRFDYTSCVDAVNAIISDNAEAVTSGLTPEQKKAFKPQILAFAKKLI